jgi:protoheme ferro-lyase
MYPPKVAFKSSSRLSFTPWLQPGVKSHAMNLTNRFNGFLVQMIAVNEKTVETVFNFQTILADTGLKPRCD